MYCYYSLQSYFDQEKEICIGEYLFEGVFMDTFFYYFSIGESMIFGVYGLCLRHRDVRNHLLEYW